MKTKLPFFLQKMFRSKKFKMLFDSIYSLTGLLIYQLFAALSVILIARKVLPVHYAQYVSISAFLSITVVVANLGLDSWFLSSANGVDNFKNLWSELFYKKIKYLFFWMLIVILIGYVFLKKEEYPTSLLLLLLISFYIENLTQSIYSLLRVLNKYRFLFIIQSTISVLYIFLVILIPKSNSAILVFAVIKILIAGIIFLFCAIKLKKLGVIFSNSSTQKNPINSISFLIADISAKIYSTVDLFLLSIFIGNSATSMYAPALSMISFSFLIPNSLYFVVLPWMSNQFLLDKKDIGQVNNFFKKSLAQFLIQIIYGVLLFSFFYFFSEYIILLTFGKNYFQAVQYLKYLSLIPFLKSINFGLGAILTSSGHQNRRTIAMVTAAVLNLLGNLIMINLYGVLGAVIVYNLSELVLVGLYFYLLTKRSD